MKMPPKIEIETERQTLAQVSVGSTATVKSLNAKSATARRLMEMGITPGVSIRVVKTAPFGCPLEIRVRGYHLALRKSEAEVVEVFSLK